jgi:hypothetical protein
VGGPGGPPLVQVQGALAPSAPSAADVLGADLASGPASAPASGPYNYGMRYITPSPILRSTATRNNVMYEQRYEAGPSYFTTICERTDKPGVNSCRVERVATQGHGVLVPRTYETREFEVLKGFDVNRRDISLPDGRVIHQQEVRPDVSVFGSVRRVGAPGRPVPVRLTAEQEAAYNARASALPPYTASYPNEGLTMFGGRAGGEPRGVTPRQAGAGPSRKALAGGPPMPAATAAGAVAQVGGQYIRMPRRSQALRADVKFGPEDIQNFELASLPGVVKQPLEMQDLDDLPEDGKIRYYSLDKSYGTVNTYNRDYGYRFADRYLPYALLRDNMLSYLEWLVSLSLRLRHQWPEFHTHNFDPVQDTVATMESYVIVTFGRLGNAKPTPIFFDRFDFLKGAEEHRRVMSDALRVFAFKPKQVLWDSELSDRYKGGAAGVEQAAIDNVELMARLAVQVLKDSENVTESISISFDDAQIMAIMEDTLMSLLARMQYFYGFTLNTANDMPTTVSGLYGASEREFLSPIVSIAGLTRSLLSSDANAGQRRFTSRGPGEFARYLEAFQQLDPSEGRLHYCPQLRLRLAQAMNIPLPRIDVSEAVLRAPIPAQLALVRPPMQPTEYYQTVVPATVPQYVGPMAPLQGGAQPQATAASPQERLATRALQRAPFPVQPRRH